MTLLQHFLPLLSQLSDYGREQLQGDLSAGLTVGVMLIPQGMAYALIAGLSPIYGLYASLVPLVVYAIFGTSRQLAVGPVAMVSLLVAAAVAPVAEGSPHLYVGLAVLLSLMVGVIVSLIVIIYESSTPHTAVMGRLPDTETYRNLKRNPEAMTRSHVVVLRMDANLSFANVSTFQDLVLDLDVNDPALEAIVIDMYPVNQIDSTATHTLRDVIETCRRGGVRLYLAGVPIREEMHEDRFRACEARSATHRRTRSETFAQIGKGAGQGRPRCRGPLRRSRRGPILPGGARRGGGGGGRGRGRRAGGRAPLFLTAAVPMAPAGGLPESD